MGGIESEPMGANATHFLLLAAQCTVQRHGLVAVAPIEPPEWMAASGASSEDIEEWERHARAQLAADWRRRLSITLA